MAEKIPKITAEAKENYMEERRSWEEAHARALELCKQKQFKDATYYFINALAQSPGNMQIIEDYASAVLDLTGEKQDRKNCVETLHQLEWLETLLRERVPYVATGDLARLLELASDVAEEKGRLSEVPAEALDPKEQMMAERLAQLQNGELDESIPDFRSGIQKRLDEFESLREYAIAVKGEDDEDICVRRLDALIGKLRITELIQEVRELIEISKQQKSSTASAYCLQLCETSIRQLIVLRPTLTEGQQVQVDQLLEELKMESESITDRRRKEESETAWSSFEKEWAAKLDEVKSWTPPRGHSWDGLCQEQINKIRYLLQQTHGVLSRLPHTEVIRKASERLEELNTLAMKASMTQQKRYNEWALAVIRQSFKEGVDAEGIAFDDKRAIGKALVLGLGWIDTRLLTVELQRCYVEVFEHLFNKLSGPKDKDDFVSEGSKLKVLKDMFAMEKKKLEDF